MSDSCEESISLSSVASGYNPCGVILQRQKSATSLTPPKKVLYRDAQTDESGQGLAEYVIIVIVVAVAVIVSLKLFGFNIGEQFFGATKKLESMKSSKKSTSDDQTRSSSSAENTTALESPPTQESAVENSSRSSDSDTTVSNGQGASKDELTLLAESMSSGVGDDISTRVTELKLSTSSLLTIGLVVCAIGTLLVARLVKKTRKQGAKKKSWAAMLSASNAKDQSGQAIVEFLLSIVSFLFCILGVIQLALCLNAFALVRYAAYNAARAGVVHGVDMSKMQDAARISLLPIFPRHGRADHLRGVTENYLGAAATDQSTTYTFNNLPITQVKVLNNNSLNSGDVVTFDDPAEGRSAIITVQVVHQYELIIPLVNRILYYLYRRKKTEGIDYQGQSVDNLAATTDKLRRNGDLKDVEYRIPIVAHYTMRLQSDYEVP